MDASVETNAAAAPAANGTAAPAGSPRLCSRTPFRSVAPAMIGSAEWRDKRLASTRVKRRHRAAASVAPLRETPGSSEHACATPSHSASSAPASAWVRSCGDRSATAIAIAPTNSPAATVGGVPRWPSIQRSNR